MSKIINKKTHLVELLENEKYAKDYFSNKPIENYRAEKYLELEKQTFKIMKKCRRQLRMELIAENINLYELINIGNRRKEMHQERYSNALEQLRTFESDLAYLILTDKIPSDESWYSPLVVKTLLESVKSEIEQAEVHYYETDGSKTLKLINDRINTLPYIPLPSE